MTPPGGPREGAVPGARRFRVLVVLALVAVVLSTGVLVARRARREARREEMLIVQGFRKICRLATVEVSLADYARRTVPKTVDLPFTTEPEAYLFYSGVAAAGFDVCDEGARIDVDHRAHEVHVRLPAPRLLSLEVKRFETINERSGFLNAIAPEDRNRWFQEARAALEHGALAQGLLPRAAAHARELVGDFVERWGYRLDLEIAGNPGGAEEAPSPPGLAR
jgi:Protein of unknown function (DUF4230)